MTEQILETLTINPAEAHKASIIWLHGLGADGHDFEPIVPELALPATLGIRFVFPHAPIQPVTINGGMPMRAWYNIDNLDFSGKHDVIGVNRSQAAIINLIETEHAKGIPTDKIFLAGFSQGGVIALHTGLSFPQTLAGIIALSTYLPSPQDPSWQIHDANRNTPIFMAHGTEDNVVAFTFGENSKNILIDQHCDVEWHQYPMPHAVCPAEINAIGQWIRTRLAS